MGNDVGQATSYGNVKRLNDSKSSSAGTSHDLSRNRAPMEEENK